MGPVGEIRSMKKIPLTKGKFAIVDDEDFVVLSRFKWNLHNWGHAKRTDTRVAPLNMENYIIPSKSGHEILHRNGNKLDNRKENLLLAKHSVLCHRSPKKKTAIHSKYKGVTYDGIMRRGKHTYYISKPWRAYACKNYIRYNIGRFKTEKEAAEAYNKKVRGLYGELAYQNKI